MTYLERVVDTELDALLPHRAAIAIDGPKGVGKTATAERRSVGLFRLDSRSRRETVLADPEVILRARRPVLLDEWQLVPEIWDVVRRQVDADPTPGQFLLTGERDRAAGRVRPIRGPGASSGSACAP